ncbi:hypothetical protein L6452_18574 [Arctium lappa]|uniref:Uncharacterized protein n=1 Tax=Arctium lappa TaxID=4217 RepID=A0ACB9C6F0_ARCLA|nr:hypothetical protein L6452_18574 [Arctium lappa]
MGGENVDHKGDSSYFDSEELRTAVAGRKARSHPVVIACLPLLRAIVTARHRNRLSRQLPSQPGDVVVPSVFFMEGSIIQDILERRIDKCDEEMEIPEKSTNKKEDAETRNFTSTLGNTSSLFGIESIVAEGGKKCPDEPLFALYVANPWRTELAGDGKDKDGLEAHSGSRQSLHSSNPYPDVHDGISTSQVCSPVIALSTGKFPSSYAVSSTPGIALNGHVAVGGNSSFYLILCVVTGTLPNLSILGLVASERAALPTARIHPFPMRAISPLLSFEYWPSRITARFESLIARAFYFIRTTSPLLSSSPLSISFRYLSDEVLRRLL